MGEVIVTTLVNLYYQHNHQRRHFTQTTQSQSKLRDNYYILSLQSPPQLLFAIVTVTSTVRFIIPSQSVRELLYTFFMLITAVAISSLSQHHNSYCILPPKSPLQTVFRSIIITGFFFYLRTLCYHPWVLYTAGATTPTVHYLLIHLNCLYLISILSNL